jgi:hypothetical protein
LTPRHDHHRTGPASAAPAALIAAAGNKAGMCFHLSVDEVDGSGFGPVPSRLRYALVHQETHHGIAQRPTQLFGHLDHGLPAAITVISRCVGR